MRYSDRKGYTKSKTEIMKEDLDESTRNRLWNVFLIRIQRTDIKMKQSTGRMNPFYMRMWHNYFKLPIDEIPNERELYEYLRDIFLERVWYEVFNLIEYIAIEYPTEETRQSFIDECNEILKEELSESRIVGNRIVEITSEEEIKEIEEVLAFKDSLEPVKQHIETAIDLLKQKTVDGYRNSIKESISAVEAICRKINNDSKVDLSIALKVIEKDIKLHPAFKRALESLYGWTSDESGVRHCLMDESNLDADDAKFMLVACSAFINYIKGKASKANIEL